jgi:hypothetical protein
MHSYGFTVRDGHTTHDQRTRSRRQTQVGGHGWPQCCIHLHSRRSGRTATPARQCGRWGPGPTLLTSCAAAPSSLPRHSPRYPHAPSPRPLCMEWAGQSQCCGPLWAGHEPTRLMIHGSTHYHFATYQRYTPCIFLTEKYEHGEYAIDLPIKSTILCTSVLRRRGCCRWTLRACTVCGGGPPGTGPMPRPRTRSTSRQSGPAVRCRATTAGLPG